MFVIGLATIYFQMKILEDEYRYNPDFISQNVLLRNLDIDLSIFCKQFSHQLSKSLLTGALDWARLCKRL